MKNVEARSLEAVHTHTHTHTSIFIQKEKTRICQEIKNRLNQAYKKISFIEHDKNKIGYIKENCNDNKCFVNRRINTKLNTIKKIKFLHDSLSFL